MSKIIKKVLHLHSRVKKNTRGVNYSRKKYATIMFN